MQTKKLIAIILVVLTLAYCGTAALTYRTDSDTPNVQIICRDGSFAEGWAKRHNVSYLLMNTAETKGAPLHLGTFDYDLTEDGCVILSCHSIAETIVLPDEIEGQPVVRVEESAFDNCPDLKHVYVPESITDFVPLHTEQYTIHCFEGSAVHKQLLAAEAEKAAAEKVKDEVAGADIEVLKAEAAEAQRAAEEAEKKAQTHATAAEKAEADAKSAQVNAESAAVLAAAPVASEEAKSNADTLTKKANELNAAATQARQQADAEQKTAEEKVAEAKLAATKVMAAIPTTFLIAPMERLITSEQINFRTADIPFTYTQTRHKLTLISYSGDSENIVIPSSINGITVKSISFPVDETTQSVTIPDSVTKIRSPLAAPRYNLTFYIHIAVVIFGLLIALTATYLAGKLGSTMDQRFLGIPLTYSGMKYFILLLLWASLSLYTDFLPRLMAAVGIVLCAAALFELAFANLAVRRAEEIGGDIREKTTFIRLYRERSENLVSRAAPEKKDVCMAVAEAFRYTDPVSDPDLLLMEDHIALQFDAFSDAVLDEGDENLKTMSEELILLLQERARACKRMK